MSDSIKIQVYTETASDDPTAPTKAAVQDADVTWLTREDAEKKAWPYIGLEPTHDHDDGGFYKPKADAPIDPGEYLLVVRKGSGNMSPVVQRLTVRSKKGVREVVAGWNKQHGAAHQAATVSIVNVGQRAVPIDDTPQFATINVVVMDRTEWIGLASHNHFSRRTEHRDGTRYLPFATGRRNQLYKAKVLSKAAICTLLDCQGRRTLVTVKSAKPDHRSWVTIHEEEKVPLGDDEGKSRPADTADNEIGIEDFYAAIDNVGWFHPGTLIEAGVFGHGWVQGPLVWGTSDFEPSLARWSGGGGAPKDLDGRQKDFFRFGGRTYEGKLSELGLIGKLMAFNSAFKDGAKLYLWGCVHMNNVLAQCREAYRHIAGGTARDEMFTVPFPDGGRERTTLDHTKRNVALAIVSDLYGRPLEHGDCRGIVSYVGAAAQFMPSGVSVFGAATGMGSSYGMRGQDNVFLITRTGENATPFKWWKHEFGDHFVTDADGFVNYSTLKNAPLPDPGWRTERHAVLKDDDTELTAASHSMAGTVALRLPSGFELLMRKASVGRRTFSSPVAHTRAGVSGHLYIVRGAEVSLVFERGALGRSAVLVDSSTLDLALFVDDTGKTTALVAPKGSAAAEFGPLTSPLEIRETSYTWRNEWSLEAKIGEITDGVLEQVAPKFYW